MFTFTTSQKGVEKFALSIEQRTHLVMFEAYYKGEEYPRYIRLTAQQIDKMHKMLFGGRFASGTIPTNYFIMEDGVCTIKCHEDHQVIQLPTNELVNLYRYLEKHRGHVAMFDIDFKKRR
jgi:hypothetical protein